MNWISVKKRIPDDFEVVLFWHKIWKCPVCGSITKYDNEMGEIITEKTLTTQWPLASFTHWMPLPEPPNNKLT